MESIFPCTKKTLCVVILIVRGLVFMRVFYPQDVLFVNVSRFSPEGIDYLLRQFAQVVQVYTHCKLILCRRWAGA